MKLAHLLPSAGQLRRIALCTAVLAGGLFALSPVAAVAADPKPAAATDSAAKLDPQNTLILTLKDGPVVIKLRPDLAPEHVKRIKELAKKGFYDGLVFHRVLDGFMAQTGDPTGTGTSGSGQNLKAEFTPTPFVRGTCGMARAQSEDSADSQFFICFADSQFLNGKYTVWGEVVSGMDNVDKIKKGEPGSGTVTDPDKMIKLQLKADADKKK